MNKGRSPIPAFAVVGYKNTGKTTLVSRLVTEMKKRGYIVGTLKHDVHEFQMDVPGTDTDQHRQAGADVVAIAGRGGWAVQAWEAAPPSVWDMLNRIADVDIVLVEGYKQSHLPKIVLADEQGAIFQNENLENVIAAAVPAAGLHMLASLEVPVYHRDEVVRIADLIESLLD